MAIDLQKINLRKEQVINLKKTRNIETQKAKVILAMDFSGSMSGLYQRGVVQETIERILPIGMAFDDDNEVDCYLFHDGVIPLDQNITLFNADGYINKYILGKYSMGGTNYAPVINKITEDFGNPVQVSKGMFGLTTTQTVTPVAMPTYVIFITDGENSDATAARTAITNASNHGIFFQFVGIGNERFKFLQELDEMKGRVVDNANFFKVPDLAATSDDNLYKLLLAEFPSWLNLAKGKGILV